MTKPLGLNVLWQVLRYAVSGSVSGGLAYLATTYTLDFIDVVGSGETFLRPVWSNGLAGWVSGIWDFGVPLGLISTAVIAVLQMFKPRRWPVWAYCLIGYGCAVPYVLIKCGPFDYGGGLDNFSLTSIGIIFGLTYAVMDKFVWPALTWIATTRVGAKA